MEFIYDIFSGWFEQKYRNEFQWSNIIRGFMGLLLILLFNIYPDIMYLLICQI